MLNRITLSLVTLGATLGTDRCQGTGWPSPRFGLGSINLSGFKMRSQLTGYSERVATTQTRLGRIWCFSPAGAKTSWVGSRLFVGDWRWAQTTRSMGVPFREGSACWMLQMSAHRESWNEVLITAFQSLGFTLATGHHRTRVFLHRGNKADHCAHTVRFLSV